MYYTLLSSYYMMKKLQLQFTNKKKRRDNHSRTLKGDCPNDDRKVCRICLKEGTNPIYGQKADVSKAIRVFGDIDVRVNDGLPKFLCDHCMNLLKSAVTFRKTAKHSNQILTTKLDKSKDVMKLLLDSNDKKQQQIFSKGSSNMPIGSNRKKIKREQLYSKNHSDSDQLSSVGFRSDLDYFEDSVNQPSPTTQFYSPVVSEDEFIDKDLDKTTIKKKLHRVRCKVCSQIMVKGQFRNHYDLHYPDKRYMCDVCGKSFRQNCSLRRHYTTHSTDFPYKCNTCPYKASNSELLKSHLRIHRGEYKYLCTECPKRFRFKSNLNKHIVKHKEPAFSCDFCKKSYYFKRYLERHIQGEHLGQKEHVCHHCGSSFSFRKGLRKHLIDLHKYEKYKVCGRMPAYMEAELKKQEHTRRNDEFL